VGNAAPSFLTTQLSLVVLAAYMPSRGYRDPGKVPEANVEVVRDWLVLVNFHGYYSADSFRKAPEGRRDSQGFVPVLSPSMTCSLTSRRSGGSATIITPPY
jgi:hypothetical protein